MKVWFFGHGHSQYCPWFMSISFELHKFRARGLFSRYWNVRISERRKMAAHHIAGSGLVNDINVKTHQLSRTTRTLYLEGHVGIRCFEPCFCSGLLLGVSCVSPCRHEDNGGESCCHSKSCNNRQYCLDHSIRCTLRVYS